jgi:hypothetical protein
MLRTALFDLEPGVIGAVHASPLDELFSPINFVSHTSAFHYRTRPRPANPSDALRAHPHPRSLQV